MRILVTACLALLASTAFAQTIHTAHGLTPDWSELGVTGPSKANPVCGFGDKEKWTYWNCLSNRPPDSVLERKVVWVWGRGYKDERGATPQFWILATASALFSVADVENTQSCIRAHTCREGNIILGSSRAQAYGIAGSLDALETWSSWRRHKDQLLRTEMRLPKRRPFIPWQVPLYANIGAHVIGIIATSVK